MPDNNSNDAPRQAVAAFRQFTTLLQDELALARAEISQNLSRAGGGIAMICVAALMALVALNVLADALVAALAANGVPVWASALGIGGVLLLGAVILVLIGRARLRADALAPKRALRNIRRDVENLKDGGHV